MSSIASDRHLKRLYDLPYDKSANWILGILRPSVHNYKSVRYKLHPEGLSDIPEAVPHSNGIVMIPTAIKWSKPLRNKKRWLVGLSLDGYGYELYGDDFVGPKKDKKWALKWWSDPFVQEKIQRRKEVMREELLEAKKKAEMDGEKTEE